MSSPASILNGNQLQGLSAAQLEQLTTITSLAKGSGFREEKKGGEGFMGSFVDSATGQKHYVKMLTHSNERKDALGENAQEANLLSGSKGLGEMSNSMKADLLELARAVGVDDKVQKLFDSPKKNDGFKDLVSRKIALEAAKLIGDAHNDKSGINGTRFDWKAVARAEKSGDTTLGNVLLMKERKQLEEIEKEICKCKEELEPARTKKEEINKWIDNHEKMMRIKDLKNELESAVKNRGNLIEGYNKTVLDCMEAITSARENMENGESDNKIEKNSIVEKNSETIEKNNSAMLAALKKRDDEIAPLDKAIKKYTDALQSALKATGITEDEYQKYMDGYEEHSAKYREMKGTLDEVNSAIDRCARKRDELTYKAIGLKNGIEKVEKGVINVDELTQELEKTKHPNIMNKADVSKEEAEFKESLNAPEVGKKSSKLVNWDEMEKKYGVRNGGLPPQMRRAEQMRRDEIKHKMQGLDDKIKFYETDLKAAEGNMRSLSHEIKNLYAPDDKIGIQKAEELEKVKRAIAKLKKDRDELVEQLKGLTKDLENLK